MATNEIMATRPGDSWPEPPEATLALTVLGRLRQDILKGSLKPGARLAMADLRSRYAIGLSPLREALSRLAGEGLVVAEGQRGFRVAPFSPADLDDLTFVRQTIEAAALSEAMAQGDERWEAQIVAAFHLLERRIGGAGADNPAACDAYEEAHRAFHLALTAGAGSPRASQLQAALYDQARRYRLLLYRGLPDPQQALDEHRQIMQRVLARDARVVALLKDHLAATRDGVRRMANW